MPRSELVSFKLGTLVTVVVLRGSLGVGREMAHVAPQLAVQTGHVAEMSVGKLATVADGVSGSLGSGASGIDSRPDKFATSINSLSTAHPNFDASGSLTATMRIGRLAEADTNPFPSFNSSPVQATDNAGGAISNAPIGSSRPVIIFNHQDFNRSGVSSYFSIAEPKLANDLAALKPPLSKAIVERIVRADMETVAQDAVKKPGSKTTFEVLTGKLKIEASRTIGGINVTGGELNVYGVAGTITGSVMTCNALADASFKNCVDAAVKTAMSSFLKRKARTQDAPLSAE